MHLRRTLRQVKLKKIQTGPLSQCIDGGMFQQKQNVGSIGVVFAMLDERSLPFPAQPIGHQAQMISFAKPLRT
jgi:hypothetical protein